jgi:glycosyltransferase involved in cell wall biosynthesis
MERILPDGPPRPGDVTLEATAALRALEAVHPEPWLLAVHPSFTTNPYQALLYQQARAHGIAPVRLRRLWQLEEVTRLQDADLPTLLHLHWLHPILSNADSARAADAAMASFLGRLDGYLAAGGRLVWTVHNVLSHEVHHDAAEARLSREVAARAAVVHVMTEQTPDVVRPTFELPPDRLLVVPHMSYHGAYEDHVSRLDARHALGLLPDELVFLALGYIRPYKGLDDLLAAWQSLEPGRRRLVIAGEPGDDGATQAFLTQAAIDPTVVLDARSIPSSEVQVFLRAADLAVLPYRHSLNSGALLLALTFGLPAIVPAGSGLADQIGPAFGRTYSPDEPGSLAAVLAGAGSLATLDAHAAAEAAAGERRPDNISRRFVLGLREMLEA